MEIKKNSNRSSGLLNISPYLQKMQSHSAPIFSKINSSGLSKSIGSSYSQEVANIYRTAINSTTYNVGEANLSGSDIIKAQFQEEMSNAVEIASEKIDKLYKELLASLGEENPENEDETKNIKGTENITTSENFETLESKSFLT